MPTLQEQDEDLAGAYSLCGQAVVSRAGFDEHRRQDVYEAIWYLCPIGFFHVGACRCRRSRITDENSTVVVGGEEGEGG